MLSLGLPRAHRRWCGRPPRFPLTSPAGRKKEDAEAIADAIKVAEDSVQDGNRPEINSELFFAAPVPTLVDLSKEAQMMVVGCRGQDALQRTLLGSVSTGLIHHAHCPVAVIHDEAPIMLQPSRLPVLVGVDGSPASELATAIAFDEASFRGVELVALHAWSDAEMSIATEHGIVGLLNPRPKETLAERLAGLQERYPDVTVHRLVVFDQPARHLLDESEIGPARRGRQPRPGRIRRHVARLGQHRRGTRSPHTCDRRPQALTACAATSLEVSTWVGVSR